MKKMLLFTMAVIFTFSLGYGQLTGTKTIPGNYASIAAAITDLNTQGVGAGGVTFNVAAGYTETFSSPTAGYITTNTGTSANPIIFQKSGAGANPKITAGVGTGTLDAIVCFNGSKYITFDGIDVSENAANTTTTQQMEWGYALLKASATQGAPNNTIKNCTITLNKANTATYGIYANNHTSASTTQLTGINTAAGTNSNNKFFNLSITNSYNGIYLNGFADANYPFTYYDQGNEIGKDGPNTFTNLAGGASVFYGIYIAYQNNAKIANNTFSGTLTSTTTVYSIYGGTGNNASADVYNNSLTYTFTGTTSTVYGIYWALGAAGVTNTLNFYNNTISVNYATATTGTLYGLYQSAAAFKCNIYGNNIVNNVLGSATTAGTGTWAGLYTFGANTMPGSQWSIYNNTLNNNNRVQSAFSTGTCYGIYSSSSGLALSIYNNTISNCSWPSSSAVYAIYLSSSSPIQLTVRKNSIFGISKPNAVTNVLPRSSTLYGMLISNSAPGNVTTIDSNTVYNFTNTWGGQVLPIRGDFGAGGTGNIYFNTIYNITSNDQAIFGIYNSTGSFVNIYRNNLYNLSAAIGDSASFYGICTGTSTAGAVTNVYNNYISDLKALQAVNYLCSGLYLFGSAAGTTFRYYDNTVYLNQSPTGGSPATAAVYANTGPALEMKNNILFNNSGIFGTGLTIAFWRSSATTGTYSMNSTSNCLYAGTPGASNLIFFDFTNSDQTLAAYMTRFPQEAQSFSEVPPFINVATTPYNLHMQTSVATQCESGGQVISVPNITNDFDLDARYPNTGYPNNITYPATAPDVGADEFGGRPNDQSPPTIVFTPLSNGPVAATRAFPGVGITDPSNVNTASGTKPRCYYKKTTNANTYVDNTSATNGWKYVEANGTATPFDFTINYSLLFGGTGVAANDTVQYFIVAQDMASTVHVGLKMGLFTTQPASVNLAAANFPITGTLLNYAIVPSISGTVTVGTGGTYTNLTGASGLFRAINLGVVTGNITANVISDLTEDGANALNQWAEAIPNANYTLTIQPSAATMRTISGTYAGGLIRLNGADRVTFDGNFSGAGRYLTFTNTATSGTIATFQIISLGTGLGATSNTIKNCVISTGHIASASYAIFAGSSTIGSTGDDNDNLTITNNIISKAYYGIYIYASVAGQDDNLVISNNTLGSATSTDYISYYGIYLYGANNGTISGNEIYNIITSTNTAAVGIEITSYTTNCLVTSNKIHDLANQNTGGWGAYGIDIGSTTGTFFNSIVNNVIYNITTINYSTASTTYNPFGIRLTGGIGTKVYHNTVWLTGTQFASGSSGTMSAALLITSTSVALPDIRDNIFANNLIGLAGSKSYAIYAPAGFAFGTCNYNDYYAYGTYGVFGYYGADVLNLAAWQTASGQDANSLSVDPQFVSATNLQPQNTLLNNTGQYLTTVPTDFNGAMRTNPPDFGALNFGNDPVVNTTAATGITFSTATLNGTINAASLTVTSFFDYGTTTAFGTTVAGVPATVTGTTTTPVSAAILGLAPNTTYYFRARGVAGGLTAYGPTLSFVTPAQAPTVVTTAASAITSSGATLNGTVNANGSSTTVTFEYGLTTAYGSTVAAVPPTVTGSSVTPCNAPITGLTPSTLYHYRIKGVNLGGTSNGSDMTFTTTALPPTVVTNPASNIAATTATLNGTVTANNSSTTVTFEWGLTTSYGNVAPGVPSPVTGNTPTAVLANISGLTSGLTYNFRCVGVNAGGTVYGLNQSFLAGCPPVGPAGTITGPNSVCANSTGKVYSIAPITNATGYTWTVPTGAVITAGVGTTTITVTFGTTSGNVSVYGTSACGNGTPSSLAVTVNPLPVPTIAGPATACQGTTTNTYTTQAGMTGYTWTVSAGGTITGGGTTNAITVTWNAIGAQSVSVNYTNANGCTATAPVVYNVTVNAAPVPTITGQNTMCVNSGYYDYSTQGGFSNYTWTISSGGTITWGQGTATVQVTWTQAGAQWVAVNYSNANGCSAMTPTTFNVTVNGLPGAAGTITGVPSVCGGATGVAYSVAAIANATSYVWNLPAGATIATGAGTNSITVNFAGNASSGNITVYGNNLCGNGTPSPNFAVTVLPLPAAAGTITGQAAVCQGVSGVIYTVSPIANASGYTWTVPSGAQIVAGSNTNSITVDFSVSAVSGNVTVLGTNSCGNGAMSSLAVTVNPIPPTPVATAVGEVLTSSAPAGNQWYFEGTLIPGATGQTYTATQSGWYWVVVTLNGCASDTSNHVYILMTGINQPLAAGFSLYPVPNDGKFTISVTSAVAGTFSLEIFNTIGLKVWSLDNFEVKGTVERSIDLRPVPGGVYTIVLKNSDNKVVKKFMVNR